MGMGAYHVPFVDLAPNPNCPTLDLVFGSNLSIVECKSKVELTRRFGTNNKNI
jgi:hypothetical protein